MDKKEFKGIYDQYHSLVSKIAYDVIDDFHLAQDITQDIFAILYQKSDSIDLQKIKGWLITCTTRKAIDYKRKTYKEKEVFGGENINSLNVDVISTEHQIIGQEIYGEILTELYHKNRQWFYLVMKIDIEGEKPEVVACELGITLNNLRVKHHRAKEWLNNKFIKKYI